MVAKALKDMGYSWPTPIQEKAIPVLMSGKDLVGQALTGSGKTSAFGIPIMERIDLQQDTTQAIVLVPTRELAMQVTRELTSLGQYKGVKVVAVYGGQPIVRQFRALEEGAHVIVGTPGRVIDHLGRGTVDLGSVLIAVLDEADEMLDVGFAQDMVRILRKTPRRRQTALFSATIPTFIRRLIYYHLKDPEWVRIGEEIETVPETRQLYCEVAERDKLEAIREILGQPGRQSQTLIFCRMQIGVDRLAKDLQRLGYDVQKLHGGMQQKERNTVMRGFRQGRPKLLVATNVAARGLDIPSISCVINYDVPDNVEHYVHRIGRTSRMGRPGTAITLVSERGVYEFDAITEKLGDEIEELPLSLYQRSSSRSS
ncbi:MAG: DEAD/DEAH box helicase [Dehalococcoidia bacterium]